MDLTVFDRMDESEIRSYLEFLLWNFRVVDGFWFLYVSEQFSQQAAERINERVWGKVPELVAKDFIKRFKIEERGLEGFLKALRLFPWCIIIGYDIEEKTDEIIISVPSCAPQVARVKKGLPEFECKTMHQGEFESFAHVIDNRIRVECLFAPPDPHPPGCFCKWRFTLEDRPDK
jgi:hypothetical protein